LKQESRVIAALDVEGTLAEAQSRLTASIFHDQQLWHEIANATAFSVGRRGECFKSQYGCRAHGELARRGCLTVLGKPVPGDRKGADSRK